MQCMLSMGLSTVDVDLGHLAEGVFITFLPCKVTHPLLSYCALWKEATVNSLHLRCGSYVSSLGR